MSRIESISDVILRELAADFGSRQLAASDLRTGYEGVPIPTLRDRCSGGSAVDFDLALEALEKRKLVKSGPMAAYDNEPGSGWVMIGVYSKREWASLTVSGYTKAQVRPAPRRPASGTQRVQITGSTFVNSPLGVGTDIHQSSTFDVSNEDEAFARLLSLAGDASEREGQELEDDVRELVEAAKAGDLAKAKPLYQRLFGFAVNGIQQVAWGVVSTLVSAHMGIPSGPPK